MSNELIKIVIAEDDPQIAEIQQRFVQRIQGVELMGVANSIEETKDLIHVFQPNLLLLDIQFPEGNGLELLNEMRASKIAIDVILVTAATEVATLTNALRSGVFDYILKPVNFNRLEASIQKYKNHLRKLSSLDSIAQSEVDEFMRSTQLPKKQSLFETRNLPKGIDAITLESVKALFASGNLAYTAENVGELIGAGRTTARRYLEYLVVENYLKANVSYGAVGRPERRYSLIDD